MNGAFIFMKKLIAFLIMLSAVFSSAEIYAITPEEVFSIDLTEKSGVTEEMLQKALLKSLSPLAKEFVLAEKNHGVNAIFLAAVAALESGWGEYCFRENNLFGWSGKSFSSKEECIDFVAEKIAENYLSEEGKYHNGKNLSGVNICYNGNLFWEEKVAEIMLMIAKKCENFSENGEDSALFKTAENAFFTSFR